ncbi:hypothetical protein RF11_15047 [Thelohanellus kitauei]|uniref:Uncharacterized protein n=1 Tax=Thelohanellus kitauei TaxID=669202 RepID=A0A0C2J3Z9_THEKT|nr:hypothetical protein RF11_15047 [Thelohanellus kitauei]
MRGAAVFLMVQKFCLVLLVSYFISTDTQLRSIRSDEQKTRVSISKPATHDDYMNSLDTLKGRRHCVLRESKTRFKTEDVHDPVKSVRLSGSFQKNELFITPYAVAISSRAGDQLQFDIKVKTIGGNKVNIYFLVHRTAALANILGVVYNNIAEIFADINASQRFPGSKIGIGEFSDIPKFPFVSVPSTEDEKK